MKTPELLPENHVEIYDYFRDFEASPRVQGIGFAVMHRLYNSKVNFEDEARETMENHLEHGGSVIVAPNHQSNADIPTIAGLVYEESFAPLRNTTIIPAKAEVFEWMLFGKFFPHMLAHPTFRSAYFYDDEEGRQLKKQVSESLINFNIDHLNDGGHIAIFSEAHRNKDNPSQVQKLKTGIGRIASGVDDPDKLLILPLGIAYRSERVVKLRPLVVVGEPYSPAGQTQEKILIDTHDRIQSAVTRAFDLAGK